MVHDEIDFPVSVIRPGLGGWELSWLHLESQGVIKLISQFLLLEYVGHGPHPTSERWKEFHILKVSRNISFQL